MSASHASPLIWDGSLAGAAKARALRAAGNKQPKSDLMGSPFLSIHYRRNPGKTRATTPPLNLGPHRGSRRGSPGNLEYGRGVGEEPNGDHGIGDCAAQRGGWEKRNNRVAIE